MNERWRRLRRENPDGLTVLWPADGIPDLAYRPVPPLLFLTVTTPLDQASVHRDLAALGYVPELIDEGRFDRWMLYHPDGVRPA